MFFLNLSLPELMALWTAASGVIVTLYLLDRSRKRIRVPTLRFWQAATQPVDSQHRRRLQEPWSLALQLVCLALLLLALAQLRLGSPDNASRDHVLILDTSSWMAARSAQGTLLQEAKAQALAYLRALPSADRVMLVRADAVATPVTAFQSNRSLVEDAIRASQAAPSALYLERALQVALEAQRMHARRRGEVVYAGAGRVADRDPDTSLPAVPELRWLRVRDDVENCGLRRVGLRRSALNPELWEIFASARNYGTQPRAVILTLQFGGAPAGSRRMLLPPGGEQSARFEYRTKAAGWLEARLLVRDGLPDDDRAILELPAQASLAVVVYSDDAERLRPLFTSNPRVQAAFLPVAAYDPARPAQLVVLDRFRPPRPPTVPSVWIEPPAESSPLAVRTTRQDVPIRSWNAAHPLGAGLKGRDLRVAHAQVLSPDAGDVVIAESEAGPLVVARESNPRMVVLGFHPVGAALRFELATPLLFANILQWMEPESFRLWELNASSVGSVNVPVEGDPDPATLTVTADGGQVLPFHVNKGSLQFFAGAAGTIRVREGARERVFSLTLPEIAESKWSAPASARQGVPRFREHPASSRDVWQWLALLAGLGLLLEWIRYGRRRAGAVAPPVPMPGPLRKAS